MTSDPRWRQQPFRIEEQIVAVDLHCGRALQLHETLELEPEEIEDTFRYEAGRFDRGRMDANSPVRCRRDRAAHRERHADAFLQRAALAQLIALDGDLEV